MTKLAMFSVLCFAVACGDDGTNNNNPDGGGGGDGGPSGPPRAVVVAGTFSPGTPGVMSVLDITSKTVMTNVAPSGAVGADPILRRFGNELFVVNRNDGNNVTILDASDYTLKEQLATGAGSNPQDVAIHGTKLFVPALGTAGVVVLERGSSAITTIDLSALDPDGKPDCVSAYTVGDEIYVVCGTLDAMFEARGSGKIVVIDAATNQQKGDAQDQGNRNPLGNLEKLPAGVVNGDLIIPTIPTFGDFTTGCVERIRTGANPGTNACLVTNSTVDGYVGRIDFQDVNGVPIAWIVASKFDSQARGTLWGYDLAERTLWPEPISGADHVIADVTVCPGDAATAAVVAADKAMGANGLRMYVGGAEVTTAPLAVGLNPQSPHGLVCY